MVMFFICFIFISIALLISSYYTYYINNVIGQKDVNRTLQVEVSKGLEIYKEDSRIENFYKTYRITVNYMNKSITINRGNEKLNDNEVLLSSDLMEDEELIDSFIYFEINNKQYKYKFAGKIDEKYQTIYLNQKQIEKIADDSDIEPLYYTIVVSEYKYVSQLISELLSKGIYSDLASNEGETEINVVLKIKQMSEIIAILILVITIVILINIINNIYLHEEKNIALLKALGYKYIVISFIVLTIINIIIIIPFLIVIILNYFVLVYLNNIINFTVGYDFLTIYLEMFLLILLFLMVKNTYNYKKIKIMNVNEILLK